MLRLGAPEPLVDLYAIGWVRCPATPAVGRPREAAAEAPLCFPRRVPGGGASGGASPGCITGASAAQFTGGELPDPELPLRSGLRGPLDGLPDGSARPAGLRPGKRRGPRARSRLREGSGAPLIPKKGSRRFASGAARGPGCWSGKSSRRAKLEAAPWVAEAGGPPSPFSLRRLGLKCSGRDVSSPKWGF